MHVARKSILRVLASDLLPEVVRFFRAALGFGRNFRFRKSESGQRALLRRAFACRYRRGARHAGRKWFQFET